jgi:hypothetical protein
LTAAALFFLFASASAGPVAAPAKYIITIKSLELKSELGQWRTIVEPDHEVDLLSTEARISFFNHGRVPQGKYSNFKILLLDDSGRALQIFGKKDFSDPLEVKKNSFIGARFVLDLQGSLPPKKVEELHVTVDDQNVTLGGDDLVIQS